MTVSFNDCVHVLHPLTRGWKLELVLNLVWQKVAISSPMLSAPLLMNSFDEIIEILNPWVTCNKRPYIESKMSQSGLRSQCAQEVVLDDEPRSSETLMQMTVDGPNVEESTRVVEGKFDVQMKAVAQEPVAVDTTGDVSLGYYYCDRRGWM